jgi:hypothetical protein
MIFESKYDEIEMEEILSEILFMLEADEFVARSHEQGGSIDFPLGGAKYFVKKMKQVQTSMYKEEV